MKYTTTIALMDGILDTAGETLSGDVEVPTVPVQVTYGFQGLPIGSAYVIKEGDKLVAEIDIEEEAMNTEVVESLHGVIGGSITERKGPVIKKWIVRSIGLTPNPADKRLPKLKRKE